jgi:hypothetical protein
VVSAREDFWSEGRVTPFIQGLNQLNTGKSARRHVASTAYHGSEGESF